ncbi:MAG: hypothetical protein BZY79_03895 [SAR202 cluster bacterium Casp-Chloro-G4]|nr:hypothetical protein [Chloroflexota bacterium]MDA1228239.1 hypothetical protein [Chloroflexota bacterium]PKB61341.1 MAG: hypothetical protein BZY79_03895 [SAR202 cluster bacterium Casp-Chloro-G4]
MAMDNPQPDCRVVYVGTGRMQTWKFLFLSNYEDERTWRQRLATEMEDVCRDMLQQGLRLTHVVPVMSSRDLNGGWTEGAWLYFSAN